MATISKAIYIAFLSGLFFFGLLNSGYISKNARQENHPPIVKIITPKNNSTFDWDTPTNYEVEVADKEDGDTKFDEINTKEVLLEVRYFSEASKLHPGNSVTADNAPGLAIIRTANCFNCHDFESKSIGPTLNDIARRYPLTKRNLDSLTKHVRDGSSGIWGKEKMPTHTELTLAETSSAVQWILKNAAAPNINYYTGTTGTFRVKRPAKVIGKGNKCLLIASYTDHGLKNADGKRLTGQDVVIISTH